MREFIPVFSRKILLIQLLAVLMFVLTLSGYLFIRKERERIEVQHSFVLNQFEELGKTRNNIENYLSYLAGGREYEAIAMEHGWEEVVFEWQNLTSRELVGRLGDIKNGEKLFVLDSFVTELSEKRGLDNSLSAVRSYTLRGYFLCQCQ